MKTIFIIILLLDIGNILSDAILFDIVSGEPKTLQSPGIGHNYFFTLPVKKNDKGFIAITHNKRDFFFEELKKHEFSTYSQHYRESSVSDLTKNKLYTKKIIDNKIIISFSFEITHSDTKYFGIEIKGTSNLNYLTVLLLLGKNSYNIKVGALNIFNRLYTGIPYFYYFPAIVEQNITINISTDCTTKKFLDEMNIYEYQSKDQKELILSKQSVEFKSSQNQVDLYSNYIVSKESTNYIAFEVMSYYDLDYINLEITNNLNSSSLTFSSSLSSFSYSNDKISSNSFYLIITFSIIFLFTIISIVICMKKGGSKENNLDSYKMKPLYTQN